MVFRKRNHFLFFIGELVNINISSREIEIILHMDNFFQFEDVILIMTIFVLFANDVMLMTTNRYAGAYDSYIILIRISFQ